MLAASANPAIKIKILKMYSIKRQTIFKSSSVITTGLVICGICFLVNVVAQAGEARSFKTSTSHDLSLEPQAVSQKVFSQGTPTEQFFDSMPHLNPLTQLQTPALEQSLQALQAKYHCFADDSDRTLKDASQSTTRNELATALSSCINKLPLEQMSLADQNTLADLKTALAAELTLQNRVEALRQMSESFTVKQFSPTTKVQGEVVITIQYGRELEPR